MQATPAQTNLKSKVIPIIAADDSTSVVSLYQSDRKIYSRSVTGWFDRWRWTMVWVTQLVFYGLPWLSINDRQAVLFELASRRFYVFNLVFYPQDLIYLTGLLIVSALSLFLFTAVAGRLWCGYACPQTVYTELFMWAERKTEGDRVARMRLDSAPFGLNKATRKLAKHTIWIAIGLWTGFTFVGYFTPIHVLIAEVRSLSMGSWEVFWVFFYGMATYGNAGWMREQVCKYMCPYARFQSAMFDRDTLIVTYDSARGEGRGSRPRSKPQSENRSNGLGDCVDCGLCVQVCPTGIDIRNGLQYECISCSACIDVCDGVMAKMAYPKGLIRYSTQNGLEQNWSSQAMFARIARPRVLIYAAVLTVLAVGLLWALVARSNFKVDVVRDRGAMARMIGQGQIENVYRLQIMNATERSQQYELSVQGLDGVRIASDSHVEVEAAGARWIPVRVQVNMANAPQGSSPIKFVISSTQSPSSQVIEKSVFLAPRSTQIDRK